MFRFPQQAAARTASPARTSHLLRRALLFGAGLILLWVALQLAPKRVPAPAEMPRAKASDEADDGVAVRSRASTPSLFSAGNVAVFVLLAGGAGAAFYLRRRSRERGGPSLAIHSLGQMSLAPNQQLRLIRCGDDVLLLGVTAGQITLLKQYEWVAFAEADVREAPEAAPASDETAFGTLLRQQLGGSFAVLKREAPC
jgi:flagellar protein FliO/FliZ